MPNKLLYTGITGVFVVVAVAAFYFSYATFKSPRQTEVEISKAAAEEGIPVHEAPLSVQEAQPEFMQETAEAVSLPEKITEATTIVYEYYYEDEGKTERIEQKAPQSLMSLTREQLEKALEDFSVSSFSANEVVLRKSVLSAQKSRYILGVWEGFVAVFYADGSENSRHSSGLKELTDTPASSLSHEERERLQAGVEIIGDDELMKVLEDYGS